MEADIIDYLDEVEELGGTLRAIEQGFFQREIADFAYDIAKRKASGDLPVIGVNKLRRRGRGPEDRGPQDRPGDRAAQDRRCCSEVKAARDEDAAQARARAARRGRPRRGREPDAGHRSTRCKAKASMGEIVNALEERLRALRRDARLLSGPHRALRRRPRRRGDGGGAGHEPAGRVLPGRAPASRATCWCGPATSRSCSRAATSSWRAGDAAWSACSRAPGSRRSRARHVADGPLGMELDKLPAALVDRAPALVRRDRRLRAAAARPARGQGRRRDRG